MRGDKFSEVDSVVDRDARGDDADMSIGGGTGGGSGGSMLDMLLCCVAGVFLIMAPVRHVL